MGNVLGRSNLLVHINFVVPTIFATSGKKTRPKWAIYKYVLDNSKKCLSVGNFGILSVVCLSVARLQPIPAYVEA